MSGNMKGLAHIGVFTADMEGSLAFYQDVLGMVISYQKDLVRPGGTTRLGFVNAGSLIVELIQPSDTQGIQDKKNGIVDHIAIEVSGIDGIIQRLKDHGVALESPEAVELPDLYDGVKNIFFSGPNGERLELFEFSA
jgi:lactoylglutathione lyase